MPSRARIDFTVRMQRSAASPRLTIPMQRSSRSARLLGGIEVLSLEFGEPEEDLARDLERAAQAAVVGLRLEPRDPRAHGVAAGGQPPVLALRVAAQIHAQHATARNALHDP